MKTTKPRPSTRSKNRYALIERKFPGRKFIEFPGVNGRVVEKIEMFTTDEYHSIIVSFQDKTALTLAIDPGFTVQGTLDDVKTGDIRTMHRWPPVACASHNQ